jgi:hypothetical protein
MTTLTERPARLRRPDVPAREDTAERLLIASTRHTLDPAVEVDWAAPLDPDKFFIPEHRVSLYGTSLWQGLSRAQRIELSKHEVASTASVGIWFEIVLMQLLTRHIYSKDPRSAHVHYALTELADECRHSMMFADMISKLDAPAYGPGPLAHNLARALKTVASGPEMFTGILLGEEILDTWQRELMKDESVQPLTRQVTTVHVIEEARHVRYAREELARQIAETPRALMPVTRFITARAAYVITTRLVHPGVYAAVGLDPKQAAQVARHNPYRRESIRWAGSKLVEFLDSLDLVRGPGMRLWKACGLVA